MPSPRRRDSPLAERPIPPGRALRLFTGDARDSGGAPPEGKTKGDDENLGGYHCWAFFRVPGKTWVPVDCSEANRNADKRDYFFGGHTSNRVTLSTGRDLTLVPAQEGAPLNYFLNPHAEADGKPVRTDKIWSYRDLN